MRGMKEDRGKLVDLNNQYNKLKADKTVDKQSAGKIQELEALVASLRIELDHEQKERKNLKEENRKINQEHTDVRVYGICKARFIICNKCAIQ